MITRSQPASRAFAVPSWLLSWRGAAGLTATAAGAAIVIGALLPWVEEFAGLIQISGVRGSNGRILAAGGAVIAVAGIWELVRGGQTARWLAGLAAFATLLFPPATQTTFRRDRHVPALAWAGDRQAAGLRRGLTVALAVVWLVDAALQFQPYMFTRAFSATMLAPMSTGQPGIIAGPVTLLARMVAENPVEWNAMFATIQLALAVGLLFRATTRAALAGTIVWSLSVWWLGEGAGGIFTGAASPLTGAPGAALLYALLAAVIWPGRRDDRPGSSVASTSALGRYAQMPWLLLWGGLAGLMLTAPNSAASLTSAGGSRADIAVIAFTAAFAMTAAGILIPATIRPALVIAVIAAAVIWSTGEHFGGILTGHATDPNTGPLLVLMVIAFWPRKENQDHDPEREVVPTSSPASPPAR